MFGYIKKDDLMKLLKEEMLFQETMAETNRRLAAEKLELKLKMKDRREEDYYASQHYTYRRFYEEANSKWAEAATIYNIVKEM